MRKILKAVLTAAVACVSAVVMSICVSAETEDVELSTSKAKTTNGAWGQSIVYDKLAFDCSRITPDSIITVEFELDGNWVSSGSPIELILQNYSTADPQIWAKIEPFELDLEESVASFRWDEMVLYYGSEDLSGVDNMCVGDCGVAMTVTKFTITNCTVVEVTTTTTTVTTTESIIEITDVPEETTAVTTVTTASSTSSQGGAETLMKILPFIVGGTILLAVIVTVIIVVKKNKGGGFY